MILFLILIFIRGRVLCHQWKARNKESSDKEKQWAVTRDSQSFMCPVCELCWLPGKPLELWEDTAQLVCAKMKIAVLQLEEKIQPKIHTENNFPPTTPELTLRSQKKHPRL